jgi:hypothetical protein
LAQGGGLVNIEHLAFREALFDVDYHNFAGNFAHSQHIGAGGAHIPGADNRYFTHFYLF